MKKRKNKKLFEVIPGFLSWFIILGFLALGITKPIVAAAALIVYLMYWVCRLLYMNVLLWFAHYRMVSNKNTDWLKLCNEVSSSKKFSEITHVVLYTIYKESGHIIEESLSSLKDVLYPKDKMIIVLAGEERVEDSFGLLNDIKSRFKDSFKEILVTVHPKDIKGEIPCKGANASYASKKVKDYLFKNKYDISNVVISCFDADTCPDPNYFSCLTYHFLKNENRYRLSFQPLPIYNNNIFTVPAFARVIEMSGTFWQMIESMRHEKFITFSSHSMSFKTLVEVDYWPVNLVSDDSLIYWKCFLKFNGNYKTCPLEVPVYMDIAVGKNFWHTFWVQYKQKRRWAWGVEAFEFLGMDFIRNKNISFFTKVNKFFQILDNHINWATWGVIISFVTPFILFFGSLMDQDSLLFYNLTYIKNVIFNSMTVIFILCIFISKEFIPKRPKEISPFIYCSFVFQWLLIPFLSVFLGSLPSLDAQTRLMFGYHLGFDPTPKDRKRAKAPSIKN